MLMAVVEHAQAVLGYSPRPEDGMGEIGRGRSKKRENNFFMCVIKIKVGLKAGR